jgi:hypothetical protein
LGLGAGLLLLAAAGALLAVLPHVAAWSQTGRPRYIADGDELLYRAWSRAALTQGEPQIVDAVHAESGPLMHPWLLFVPLALLGHALRLDSNGLAIVWRAVAGAGIAVGCYLALRPVIRSRFVTLAFAALLTFDAGFLLGQILQRDAELIRAIAQGNNAFFGTVPQVMAHLRVVPPGLAIPFLLVHYGLVLRARTRGDVASAIAAAISLGFLFHVYFYFWTAVVVGAALALVLDLKGWRTYLITLIGGLILGAPAVLAGSRVRALTPPDWLHRTDKFVPIGHLDNLLIPKILIAELLILAFVVFRYRRELTYLWSCTLAALLCANHQLVTGLQIENFHWRLAVGVTFSLLVGALVASWLFDVPVPKGSPEPPRGGRWWRAGLLAALTVVLIPLGFFFRWQEGTRTAETREWASIDRTLRQDEIQVPTGAVVAGDPKVLLLSAATDGAYPLSGRLIEFSSVVTDPELDECLMLNLFLQGTSRAMARDLVDQPPGTLSWEALAQHHPEAAKRQRTRRHALIEAIWGSPLPWIEKFGVTHVIVPVPRPQEWASALESGRLDGEIVPASGLQAFPFATQMERFARLERAGSHWLLWRIVERRNPSTSRVGTATAPAGSPK